MIHFHHEMDIFPNDLSYMERNKYSKRYTLAYEAQVLTLEELLSYLDKNKTLMVTIGRANCHHKDQFNKKLGRELATSRMQKLPYILDHIQSMDEKIIATFKLALEVDENGAIIFRDKQAVFQFQMIIYRDSNHARMRFFRD